MRIPVLAALALAGCAPPPALEAQPCPGGLRVACGKAVARLRLPSMRWDASTGPMTPARPDRMTVTDGPVTWTLAPGIDLAAPPKITLRREGEASPAAILEGASARGVTAAAGFVFVYGDALWLLDPAEGRLREILLPPALRARRAADRAGAACAACLAPGMEILGSLLTPAGPDPGLTTLVSPPVRSP